MLFKLQLLTALCLKYLFQHDVLIYVQPNTHMQQHFL